jgi:hypothetical protein
MRMTLIAYLLAIILPLAACTLEQQTSDLPPGKYERTVRSTDAQGTETVKRSYTDIDEDDQGRRKVTKESEVTKDPKGLLNKKTISKSKKTVDEQADEQKSVFAMKKAGLLKARLFI